MFLAKEAAHQQLLKEIPENLLIKISLSNNSNAIQWEEEDKEFSLDGNMYDVVKLQFENGEKYALCINDENEDRIIDALEKVTRSNTDNSRGTGKHYSTGKAIIFEWLFEQENKQPETCSTFTKKEYFTYTSSLCCNTIEINSPPPNFILN